MTIGKARATSAYYACFTCMGLSVGIGAPTLQSLALQTHSPIGKMGWMFFCGSAAFMFGTALASRILDRAPGHPLMGAAQVLSGLLLCLLPSCNHFGLLLALVFCRGVCDSLVITGSNTLLVWIHGRRVGPFMNGLHLCFGVGAFLSPLLVAQVINRHHGYAIAYRIIGLIAVAAGLWMLSVRKSPTHPKEPEGEGRRSGATPTALVISAILFLFFYVGAELAFSDWLATYAVAVHLTTVAGAAYLSSSFWLSFTVGRVISVPVAMRVAPSRVVLANLGACLLLLPLMLLWPGSSGVLWAVTIGLGLFMAPLWPSAYLVASQSLHMTAAVSGAILLGDGAGAMIMPTAVGMVIGRAGPSAMVYLVLIGLILDLAAFGAMLRFGALRRNSSAPSERAG